MHNKLSNYVYSRIKYLRILICFNLSILKQWIYEMLYLSELPFLLFWTVFLYFHIHIKISYNFHKSIT